MPLGKVRAPESVVAAQVALEPRNAGSLFRLSTSLSASTDRSMGRSVEWLAGVLVHDVGDLEGAAVGGGVEAEVDHAAATRADPGMPVLGLLARRPPFAGLVLGAVLQQHWLRPAGG